MPRATAPENFKLKPVIPKEDHEQIVAATWLRKNNIPFYHIPNGGKRHMLEAIKLKRMGVSPGVPDICILKARKGYHGLYIEVKRVEGGTLSDNQKFWRDILLSEGYAWFEAKGGQDVINIVKNYLSN
jgi:hypothetical protein